jgi:phospholipid/cholesterol/gamma-HCH transport system permease protein
MIKAKVSQWGQKQFRRVTTLEDVHTLGSTARASLVFLGKLVQLSIFFFKELFRKPFEWQEIKFQCEQIGLRSLPIAAVTLLFVGFVFAFQFGVTLRLMGALPYIGKITSLSVLRELGPVFTALVVGGRIGAGMAAEIGSMRVTEQIDAIWALGANPYKKLLVPRVVAATLMLPLLALIASIISIGGSILVSWIEFSVSPAQFYHSALQTVRMWDFAGGFLKPFFFGYFTAIVGCLHGFECEAGTRGVGQATTRAVVSVSLMVVFVDFFLTRLLEMMR